MPIHHQTDHALVTDDFVFVTRRIRLPRADLMAVKPTADDSGAIIVTRRGAMHVRENFDALMRDLYGVAPSIGEIIDTEGGAR